MSEIELPIEKATSTSPRFAVDQESRDAIKKIHNGFKILQEKIESLEMPRSTIVEFFETKEQAQLIAALISVELDMLEDDNAVFEKTGQNGRGNSAAATFPDLTRYAMPFLAKNGLKILQEPVLFNNRDCIITTVSHASGQKRSSISALQIEPKGGSLHHAYSAAYTNAKKHAFAAILNLHTGND